MDDWRQVAQYLWGLLVPAGIWAWKKQDARLDKLEENSVKKDEFKERLTAVDKVLEDRRDDVRDLYKEMGELRKDVSRGFSDLKDLLLKR